jgi:PKD repeat protein
VTNCGTGPSAHFQSSDSAFCDESGKCIDFTDLTTGNPTSWKWTFPGAVPDTSTMQNPTGICYNTPGTYSVKLVATNTYGSDSLTISPLITFGSGATAPVLTLSHDTIFSSHASAYQWFLNGSPIPGATDSFYVATLDGSYNVQITDSIGCVRLGNSATFTSVSELYNLDKVEIYPNPVTKELWIVGYGLWIKGATLDLNNVLGENVYHTQLKTQNSQLKTNIDITTLSKGIYIIQVRSNDRVFRARVVKE